ncbi:MAG: hypothetical protein AAGF75_06455, partial [Cyanobacteria bacterium P01_H01_bin.130]
PPLGEKLVEAPAIAPTQNYGLTVTGVEGEIVSRTGNIHQLLWHYGSPTLLSGTWSFSRETLKTGEASKPPGTAGPAHSDDDSPGGTGFDGWPSGADGAAADGGWWSTKSVTEPSYSYWEVEDRVELISWGFSGTPQYWQENVEWISLVTVPVPFRNRNVTYDTRNSNGPPSFSREDFEEELTSDSEPPWPRVPLFNGVSYISVGSGSCDFSSLGAFSSPPGLNGGWSVGPTVGGCTLYGQYSRALTTQTVTSQRIVNNGAPESPAPNPDDFPDLPGSGVPGGGAPGSDPPGFGPPGAFPNSDWNSQVREITEYEIQSAVGPTLRSRRYFRLVTTDTTTHSANWNGSRSNSSITSGASTTTYELEHETPYAMVMRSPVNAASDTPEEVLFLVRRLSPTTQGVPFERPYPYDTETVYYQRDGEAPVAIAGDIASLFPAIAWADPEQYLWSRFLTLADGVLHFVPPPAEGLDYRGRSGRISPQAFRVDDGTLTPLTPPSLGILKGDDASSTVFDASFAAG